MTGRVLIITGMHRSGTSLMAQYLHECGLNVGQSLHNSDISNAVSAFDGHHEDQDFLNFHKAILSRKRIYSFPTNGFRLPVRVNQRDREKAIELISARSDLPLWAWKDPRTALFLDFWDSLIDRPKYLFLFRHPLAVVDSLIRRGTDERIVKKPIIGLRAWKVYNRQILCFLSKREEVSLIFEIDELIQSPEVVSKSLKQKFEIDLKAISFDQIFSKKAFRSEYSARIEDLKKCYPREIQDAEALYQKLQSITQSKQTISA
jgi:hypothetical protein